MVNLKTALGTHLTAMARTLGMSSRTKPWRENLKCNRSNQTIATSRMSKTTSSPTQALKSIKRCTQTRMANRNPKLRMNLLAHRTKTTSKLKIKAKTK